MKKRAAICCVACLLGALVMLLCGWLIPIHLRAVDLGIIQRAGKSGAEGQIATLQGEPFARYIIRRENREKTLAVLERSDLAVVQSLLRCRSLTNTVLFPPSSSASGQAFDAAVCVTGLLVNSNDVAPALSDAIMIDASGAVRGENSQPIEEILMDELSLAERLAWPQLAAFTKPIETPQTLAQLAASARNAGDQLPVLYTAVVESQQPGRVAEYLSTFSQTGLGDLAASERFGAGGVEELLRRNQRLYESPLQQRLTSHAPFDAFFRAGSDYALHFPAIALGLKFFFYLSAGFFIAVALQLVVPRTPGADGAGPSRSVTFGREILFASGVLLVALLLSEPFLAQENQKGVLPNRLRLPSVGSAIASQITHAKQSPMNTTTVTASLLTLLLFFVLQALIYLACLSRLAETLRQNVPARVKLKLLENEEHLFDAGLYLGFVGTIICLILVSLGILQFSLMAAYSSTSFGIIFVSILKIFKVRPARRRLLLQAEDENAVGERPARMSQTTLVTAP